jgi:hypothetical protein
MAKTIRPTYPKEFSVGILILIFALSLFLSSQIFKVAHQEADGGPNVYIGMVLISVAVIIMLLILWEELLFPVKVKPSADGVEFRNHSTKLKTQLLIYCIIPVIFVAVYVMYEVEHVRFFIWAAICIVLPVVGKLLSGIKNYNDFLRLTNRTIEYKNNEKHGVFALTDLQQITLVRDERKVLHKIQLLTTNQSSVMIDLDEMELEAFLGSIDKFVTANYKNLLSK